MFGIVEFGCEALKRSVASMLPWDVPWYDASHVVFFAALYGVLTIIVLGVFAALLVTMKRLRGSGGDEGH